MDEEPDKHFKIGLFTAEGKTSADQVSQSKAQSSVEALDMLGAANPVQRTENDAFVSGQAVYMTDRIEVRRGEILLQSESADGVSPT